MRLRVLVFLAFLVAVFEKPSSAREIQRSAEPSQRASESNQNPRADEAQKSAEALLDRARRLSDIRSLNAPPFRLKLTFSFTGKHLDTVQGIYDEVWISNSRWRRETTVSASSGLKSAYRRNAGSRLAATIFLNKQRESQHWLKCFQQWLGDFSSVLCLIKPINSMRCHKVRTS